jgi:probable HAF family extracellular repeat protein
MDGGMIDIGSANALSPVAVSDAGHVVGHGTTSAGRQGPALWSAAEGLTSLEVPGGPTGVNAQGQVVGNAGLERLVTRAFFWSRTAGLMFLAPDAGADAQSFMSQAVAINEAGQIIGWRLTDRFTADSVQRATLWEISLGNTPAGTDVAVALPELDVTFANVTQPGTTDVTTSTTGLPPPQGFSLGDPPVYYDVTTTAAFAGPVTLCFDYSTQAFADGAVLALMHMENGAWVDRTISHDPATRVICASVTSLSPFAIFSSAPALTISRLIEQVGALSIPQRVKRALVAPLKAADEAITRGRPRVARVLLQAFVLELRVLSRRGVLSEPDAEDLIAQAEVIIASL